MLDYENGLSFDIYFLIWQHCYPVQCVVRNACHCKVCKPVRQWPAQITKQLLRISYICIIMSIFCFVVTKNNAFVFMLSSSCAGGTLCLGCLPILLSHAFSGIILRMHGMVYFKFGMLKYPTALRTDYISRIVTHQCGSNLRFLRLRYLQNARQKEPHIWYSDIFWLNTELVRFLSVDIPHFWPMLTQCNGSYSDEMICIWLVDASWPPSNLIRFWFMVH